MDDVADKSAESAETIYVRHLIDEGLKKVVADGFRSPGYTELARRLGYQDPDVARTQLTNIYTGMRGAGPDTWEIFAQAYHGGSFDDFHRAADAFAASRHADAPVTRPYPNRAAAIEFVRRTGDASEEAIAQILQMRLAPEVPDPPGKWWLQRLEEIQRAIESGRPSPPILPPPSVVGDRLALMRRPLDWAGFPKLIELVVRSEDVEGRYRAAIVGYSEELTAQSPPTPLTVETILPCLDAFIAAHPYEVEAKAWTDWRRRAHRKLREIVAEEKRTREQRERTSGKIRKLDDEQDDDEA